MKLNPTSMFVLTLGAFASLVLLLLVFSAVAYSNEFAAIGLLLCIPVLAVVVAFKSSEAPAAIATALTLPAGLFALWSSFTSAVSNAHFGFAWPVVLVSSLVVLWLAARFGRYRKNSLNQKHNEV
jgi:hypothetical protein